MIHVGREVEWIVNKTSDKTLRRKTEQNKTNNKENKRREKKEITRFIT